MTATAEHATAAAEDRPATAGQDLLADLREAIAAARTEAGRLLACLRHTAELSQARLAGRIGYSATVVAHAELGRRPVSAEFCELADNALAAGGKLTAQGIRIRDLATARREEQHRQDKAMHARHLAQLLSRPQGEDSMPAVPAAPAPVVITPATSSGTGEPSAHSPAWSTLVQRADLGQSGGGARSEPPVRSALWRDEPVAD